MKPTVQLFNYSIILGDIGSFSSLHQLSAAKFSTVHFAITEQRDSRNYTNQRQRELIIYGLEQDLMH
jgi:hypothetical protein